MRRSPKIRDIISVASKAVEAGHLFYSSHANERLRERKIIKPEVETILTNGHYEIHKDQFNELHGTWDYAIRGKTVDGRSLRIVVALIEPKVLIVTAIDLDKE